MGNEPSGQAGHPLSDVNSFGRGSIQSPHNNGDVSNGPALVDGNAQGDGSTNAQMDPQLLTSTTQIGAHFPAGREQSHGAFDMSQMASSLYPYQGHGPTQYSEPSRYQTNFGGASAFNHPQFHHTVSPVPGQHPMLNASYGSSYHDPTASQIYGQMQNRQYPGGGNAMHSGFSGGAFARNTPSQYMLYPGQTGATGPPSGYNNVPDHMNALTGNRNYHTSYPSLPQHATQGGHPNVTGASKYNTSTGVIPSAPRGPPRKPKQSGHALWVGNLPTGTAVNELKDHFSREATKDIESVFLISKSNCAFVNYRTEGACAAAMQRFHDSRFQGVRLVCRLRRGPAASTTASIATVTRTPSGPSATVSDTVSSTPAPDDVAQNRQISSKPLEDAKSETLNRVHSIEKVPEKFFVMKSLTIEDMELSLQNKIWATQEHNEEAMNQAFATAANVYLIFSANKSGEYFGYARMASPINAEISATLDWAPKGGVAADDSDIPRSIPTQATETAPRGRIIDDSARGTIFWEAIHDEPGAEGAVKEKDHDTSKSAVEAEEEGSGASSPQSSGKSFKIEWLSTERVPFYRTRGLRNSWNANREVKIARDGTELEPSVGRRLIRMFHEAANMVDPQIASPPPQTLYR